MKKKIVALSLIAAMIAGLTACGQTAEPADTASKTEQKTESSTSTDTTQKEEVAAPEAKTVDKIVLWSNNYETDEEHRQLFCDLFKEDTGVELEWVSFPKEDYEDVLAAALMGCDVDDLPDIIEAPDDLGVLLKQEYLYDIAPLIENNATMKEVIEKNPAMTAEYELSDGRIVGLATAQFQTMTIWTRQDLLDEQGIGEIKSLDDFTEALRKVKAAYPDMIPFTAPNGLKVWEVVSNWFGAKYSIYKNTDGVFVDPTLSAEYKDFMEYVKMLYDEGLVDKELPTNTSYGTIRNKYNNGEAVFEIMWDNTGKTFMNSATALGGSVGYVMPVDGEKGTLGLNYDPPCSPVIMTTGVEDDEAQFIFDTFFNWYFTNESGVIATSIGVPGYAWDVVDGVYTEKEGMDTGVKPQSNPPMDLEFEYPFVFDEVSNYRYEVANIMRAEVVKREESVMTIYPGLEYTDYAAIASDLDSYRTELFYLYVMGEKDYDSFVNEYTAKFNELGVQDMIDNMNK